MKKIIVVAAMAFLSACASNTQTADVNTVADTTAKTSPLERGTQTELEASAGSRVYFGYDQYSLSSQAQATLRRQASWLNDNPNVKVQLAGNTDERGTREYNLALGARRAEAAKAYLVSLGISSSRLQTVSHGKERPAANGSNERAWSENRNSTTTVIGVTG